jgi:hypothetical protein
VAQFVVGVVDKGEVLGRCGIKMVLAVHLPLPEPAIVCEETLGLVDEVGECITFEIGWRLARSKVAMDGGHLVIHFAGVVAGWKGSCVIIGGVECPGRDTSRVSWLMTHPSYYPDSKRKDFIDPVFRIIVIIVVVFSIGQFALRETIRSLMFVSRHVDELEVEKQDGSDPAIDCCVGLHVGVVEHSLDVLCIHFNHKPADADEVKVECSECLKQSIELEFGLGIMRLMLIPRDRTEAHGAASPVCTILRQYPSYSMVRGVDSKINRAIRGVINGDKGWRVDYGIFEGLHGNFVFFIPDEQGTLVCEVNKGVSNSRVIFDPNMHVAGDAKECVHVREVLASWPVSYFGNFCVIQDTSFVVALGS